MRSMMTGFVAAMLLATPAVAQSDTSGKGAVLCSYAINLTAQALTQLCGWERSPSDDAIDAGIAATEAFIVENSSTPVGETELVSYRAQAAKDAQGIVGDNPTAFCAGDVTDLSSSVAFVQMLRAQSPAELEASFAELLSVPREPVFEPCL